MSFQQKPDVGCSPCHLHLSAAFDTIDHNNSRLHRLSTSLNYQILPSNGLNSVACQFSRSFHVNVNGPFHLLLRVPDGSGVVPRSASTPFTITLLSTISSSAAKHHVLLMISNC